MIPEELKYTESHEWVAPPGAEGGMRVGITDYAQGQLGDVVFVQLPAVGQRVAAGEVVGEVESTKSVSDLYAPLAGELVAVNDVLDGSPDLINSDPYGSGWILVVRPDAPVEQATADLLDAASYRSLTDRT